MVHHTKAILSAKFFNNPHHDGGDDDEEGGGGDDVVVRAGHVERQREGDDAPQPAEPQHKLHLLVYII